jgi:hypothetical protein
MKSVYRVLAIIVLLCDVEFLKLESPKHEAVYVKDEGKLLKGECSPRCCRSVLFMAK